MDGRRSARGRTGGKPDLHTIEGVDSSDIISVFKLKIWQVIQFGEGQNITLYHEVRKDTLPALLLSLQTCPSHYRLRPEWELSILYPPIRKPDCLVHARPLFTDSREQGQELSDKGRSLASYNVRADSTLYGKMFDAPEGQGVFEEGDFSTGFEAGFGGGSSASYRPEQGFLGTFLAQSHSFSSPAKPEEVAVVDEAGPKKEEGEEKKDLGAGEPAGLKEAMQKGQGQGAPGGEAMEVVEREEEPRRGRASRAEPPATQTPPRPRTRNSQPPRTSPSKTPIEVFPTPSPPPLPPQTRATSAAALGAAPAAVGASAAASDEGSRRAPAQGMQSLVSAMYDEDAEVVAQQE